MQIHYIRLKSYSTIGNFSWIEIFERGYQEQIISEGNTYQQEILSLIDSTSFEDAINLAKQIKKNVIIQK